MQQFGFDIIGTHLDIRIDTSEDCSFLFSEIEARLRDFENRYSRFISGNWLDVLNQKRTETLDTDGKKMLEYMLAVSRHTDGYFDPTVGKRLTELGYGKPIINYQLSITNTETYWNYRDIELNWDRVTLHWDILLEFGWVGKGYLIDVVQNIIDRSFRHTEERSIQDSNTQSMDSSYRQNDGNKVKTRYLINFGGDMYGRGGWKVGLESPFASDEVIGTLVLDDHFLACSAGTRRKWGTHHHLIDPHTGESANSVIASYIEWASGMIVDSYATALCVMPWERAIAQFEQTPEISGVIVSREGNIYQKKGSRAEIFR